MSNYVELVRELEPLMNWVYAKHPTILLERQDFLQEARWILYRSIQQFDASKNTKFTTYYVRALQNFLYDSIRKANRKKTIPLDQVISRDVLPEEYTDGILKRVINRENNPEQIVLLKEEMLAGVSSLSPFERDVFLGYLSPDTKKEIWNELLKDEPRYRCAYQRSRKKILAAVSM